LSGRWLVGRVRGALAEEGWGAKLGYPALILDPAERPVEVHVFESEDLLGHWDRLDAFEGPGYRRVAGPEHPNTLAARSLLRNLASGRRSIPTAMRLEADDGPAPVRP
jgi:hypothetical protein